MQYTLDKEIPHMFAHLHLQDVKLYTVNSKINEMFSSRGESWQEFPI